jgi:imidazolonepropionase-like amidohydrolase
MKKSAYAATAATLSVLVASTVYADQTSPVYGIHDRSSSHFAFTNATIYVEPGKIIENATLVIDNGRVISVKAKGKVPKGAMAIDLTSHTIYPGFIDAYSNYTFDNKPFPIRSWNDAPVYDGNRIGGNAWNDAIHAHVDWVSEFKGDATSAEKFIENGFTAVQTAKQDGIFQGQAVTVSLGNGIPNSLIYNANASHFASFDRGSSKQSYPSSLMGSVSLIRQTLSDAQWYQKSSGKADSLFTGELVEYNAGLNGVTELTKTGVLFNADDYLSTLRADKIFDEYGVSATFVADGHEYARINEIKKTNSVFVLPLNFPMKPDVGSFESQLDVSLAELRHWERAPANAAIMERQQIEFAFTQHGLKSVDKFWGQVKSAVKHGLSEKTALAALTIVPAKLAGISASAGQLKAGMFADFVITDGNIFTTGKIKSVYMQGKEKRFAEINPISFAGNYQFTVADEVLTLALSEKENKLSGFVVKGEKKQTIIVHSKFVDALQFSANLTSLGLNGVYRFSGRINGDLFVGHMLNDSAERVAFSAIKEMAKREQKKIENQSLDDKNEALVFVGNLTFPNRAFGLSGIPKQPNIHIKNATVWTSEDAGTLSNSDILISKGKIYKIGRELKTPKGYLAIDGTGKHVTAGIIDEHSHVAISKGVNEASDAITSEVRIGDVVNPDDINIYHALAGGTTMAQLLHGSANPVGGQAQVIKMRWGADAETMKEKRAPGSIKFALGENVKQSNWGDKFTGRYPQTRMGVETIVRDAFIRAQDYKASWDKYDDLSRSGKKLTASPRRNFRLDALVEILDKKRFVHSHSYIASEILSLMKIAESFDFTIQTFTHILEGYKVADEMAAHGASASTFADWWAFKFEVMDAIPTNTCIMMDRGVNVSVNSDDAGLIRRLNTEAAKSVQYCGMSQENAIKMITINPAIQLKVDEFTGSLKKGKDADFVIWSGNPLSIYSKVEQTWIDGRNYFDRAQDNEMRLAIAKEKNSLIQKVLSTKDKNNSTESVMADNKSAKPKISRATMLATNTDASEAATNDHLYILKEEALWKCDDHFDFWQWRSAQRGGQQ